MVPQRVPMTSPSSAVNPIVVSTPLRVFLRRRMTCVGCEIVPFHTVAVARIYGVPAEALLHELRELAGAAAAWKAVARSITPRRRIDPDQRTAWNVPPILACGGPRRGRTEIVAAWPSLRKRKV